MSYCILYNKQFIKVDNSHVIPFMLAGDNNVYEAVGRGTKRARDWSNDLTHCKNGMIVANADLLKEIDNFRENQIQRGDASAKQYNDATFIYDDKKFGWHTAIAFYGKHTSKTTFKAYKNFYIKGIKEAKTIEELKANGVSISVSLSYYTKKDMTERGIEIKEDVTFASTEHMIETLAEWQSFYKGKNISFWLNQSGMDRYIDKKITKRRFAHLN